MLETRAIVMQIKGRQALVQANQGNGCEQCNGKGCGTGKLSQMFCSKPRQFQVDNPIDAGVGDEVIVSVADGAVLQGIGLVYLLPLALLLAGAVLGGALVVSPEQRDAYAGVGAALGLLLGFVAAKWVSSRQSLLHHRPYIARRFSGD